MRTPFKLKIFSQPYNLNKQLMLYYKAKYFKKVNFDHKNSAYKLTIKVIESITNIQKAYKL